MMWISVRLDFLQIINESGEVEILMKKGYLLIVKGLPIEIEKLDASKVVMLEEVEATRFR